jgi:3',5'-cyclic AMP phosphodiesterase CpdA
MKLRIAVISDLHAHQKDRPSIDPGHAADTNVSYLPANPGPGDPNPFGDLQQLISSSGIKADILICPGDICDKGDIAGFTYAWKQLHILRGRIGASELIATCGNHDLDSRYSTPPSDDDPDPKGNLLQAEPPFPFGDIPETDQFWARNFATIRVNSEVRVISLNTSAYHGGKKGELEYGRVSHRTIKALVKTIEEDPQNASLNILLCHHHLQPLHSWGNTIDDLQHVRKGTDLVTALTKATGSAWLVIHGHRHIPNISHSTSPPVAMLGAGSFSRIGDTFTNQFHIIDVEVDPLSTTMPLCGEIRSWNWSRSNGWAVYLDPTKGLPPQCGFGYPGAVQGLVPKILNALGVEPFLYWDTMLQAVPELRYLTPDQWKGLSKEFLSKGLVVADVSGLPSQIARKR